MRRFDELLLESMNETLKGIFGEQGFMLICRLSEKHLCLRLEESLESDESFIAYLETLLGSKGAQVIQDTSLRRLCTKLRREHEEIRKYFSFLDKLYEAKFKLLLSCSEGNRLVCN